MSESRPFIAGRHFTATLRLLLIMVCVGGNHAYAKPAQFHIPAQSASDALLLLSQQASCDILFSFNELKLVKSNTVSGFYEPSVALELLLQRTGFRAHPRGKGKFIVTALKTKTGIIKGRILKSDGSPARRVKITLLGAHRSTATNRGGGFTFRSVPPGNHNLLAEAQDHRSIVWENIEVHAAHTLELKPQTLQPTDDLMQLEPFIVTDKAARKYSFSQRELLPRIAVGNIDLPRSEDDALPYKIYERDQIARSGVVDLNDFLRRELLDSDASTLPPEQNGAQDSFLAGSSNLNLRGYGSDATIILVNGRRLPESSATVNGMLGAPDVNSIPLSLVQQVEVLPSSASSIYNGNPVGGVINIVLRPEIDHTEVTTTYTNAVGDFDAPNSSVSLLHGRTLLDDRFRLRFNATYAKAVPATESELGYRRTNNNTSTPTGAIYRGTPNIRSANNSPLFALNSATTTSVKPGAKGNGGIGDFSGREGLRNFSLFDSPGGFAASPDSMDNPFGRRQQRQSYFISVVYDAFSWLQIGIDSMYTKTVVNRGYDVFRSELKLDAASSLNPFGQDILVSLNETAPDLGENYNEAKLELFSTLVGAIIDFPADWKLSLDAQFSRNIAHYRGFAGVDKARWQQLVDQGKYNPLRDTQVLGPPQEFYDQALLYFGTRNRFAKLGDYLALDTAIRATNQSLQLPTGTATTIVGFDYRLTQLEDYAQRITYADGSLATPLVLWDGRTLERLSIFGELQAPLLPTRKLPSWIEAFEMDIAVRYIMADTSRETNFAPTIGLKVDFSGGLSLRGSASFSNRFPTSAMSRRVAAPSTGGPGINYTTIYDPLRDQSYAVETYEDLNPDIIPEGAVTQSVGLLFQRGDIHRFRASLDFVDTRKKNEILFLVPQTILNLETLWPDRVTRAALNPGDPHSVGHVNSVLTGLTNIASRDSQNWNASLDYSWIDFFGGRFDAYTRLVLFQKYERQLFPASPIVNQLEYPDGTTSGLIKYRSNFGTSWTGSRYGFGFDGHYYHSRILPIPEWPNQNSDRIKRYWSFDIFGQADLSQWISWLKNTQRLTAQLRINNILNSSFPQYANDASGAGVQAYGDWRGRTYSLSVTARF